MNGPQDLGGMMGFGPVCPEANEPVFHGQWEKRALAITLASAALGEWNLDMGRHARESLPPHVYLGVSYYEIWTRALANMLDERGMVTKQEVQQAQMLVPPVPTKKPAATAAQTRLRRSPREIRRPAAAPRSSPMVASPNRPERCVRAICPRR